MPSFAHSCCYLQTHSLCHNPKWGQELKSTIKLQFYFHVHLSLPLDHLHHCKCCTTPSIDLFHSFLPSWDTQSTYPILFMLRTTRLHTLTKFQIKVLNTWLQAAQQNHIIWIKQRQNPLTTDPLCPFAVPNNSASKNYELNHQYELLLAMKTKLLLWYMGIENP